MSLLWNPVYSKIDYKLVQRGGWVGATIGNWQQERRRRAILIPQLRSVSLPFPSSSLSLSSLLFDGNDDGS